MTTVVRPGVVICESVPERHIETTPRFVAEILSPSTEQSDRTAKFELYRSEGAEFYLLLDPYATNSEAGVTSATNVVVDETSNPDARDSSRRPLFRYPKTKLRRNTSHSQTSV